MTRLCRRLLRQRDGQSTIEMALILPILVLLTFGSLIFGMIVNAKLAASGGARESARNWAIYHDHDKAKRAAFDYVTGSLLTDTAGLSCSLSTDQALPSQPAAPATVLPSGAGCRVEIDNYTHRDPMGIAPPDMVIIRVTFWQPTILGNLFGLGQTTPMSSTAIFRVEK